MEGYYVINNKDINWEIDVPVLCIFFARPDQFRQLFERISQVKPKTLLLWQDGPRKSVQDDNENIMKCRKIVESINWNCEVYYNYHDENMGCDPSTFYSFKWAFSKVDKCIIFEDDVIPSFSFFEFCKVLLDKYENDERVDRICGQTLFDGVPDKRFDYFFGRSGSSIGWATWKRVAQSWEEKYQFLNDEYFLDLGKRRFGNSKAYSYNINMATEKREIPYWEYIIGFRTTLQSGLVIYPRVNLISNNGFANNSTHAPNNIVEIPKVVQSIFTTPNEELSFPLKHPPYVIEDYHYFEKMMKFLHPGMIENFRRRVEHQLRKIYCHFIRKSK